MIDLTPSEVALLVNLMEWRLEEYDLEEAEESNLQYVHRKFQHAEIAHYRNQSLQNLRKAV
jgi:hypothetical protein